MKEINVGDKIAFVGYARTGMAEASESDGQHFFEISDIIGTILFLKDAYHGLKVHRRQVVKIKRKKIKLALWIAVKQDEVKRNTYAVLETKEMVDKMRETHPHAKIYLMREVK
jgi:hypothetical protein